MYRMQRGLKSSLCIPRVAVVARVAYAATVAPVAHGGAGDERQPATVS